MGPCGPDGFTNVRHSSFGTEITLVDNASRRNMFRFIPVAAVLAFLGTAASAETRPPTIDQAAETIDRILESGWQEAGIVPVGPSSDAEFHRRVWLDLAGVAPPVAATRQFLADDHSEKRQQLIDRLLQSHQHANHMATRWSAILLPPDVFAQQQQRGRVLSLSRWLHDQFYNNVPYDHLVGSFLTAGGAGDAGPAIFYTSHQVQPEKVAAATSRIFMGIQLQCAECHDHPFDRWTQQDFWQFAAFFSQLERIESSPNEEGLIEDRVGRELRMPESGETVSPRYPGATQIPERDPLGIRRRQLTIWLASRDNPYFALAAANRIWGHLFGRGIVDPVDAMDANHRPSHPELLEFLADYLIQLRFDSRRFYATLARTRAYGRTSALSSSAPAIPEDSFAVMPVKTLTAEQFYESLRQNVFSRHGDQQAMDAPGLEPAKEAFVARMRSPGTSPRDYPHGVVQVLGLMNGPEIAAAQDRRQIGLLAALEAPFFDPAQRIDTVFLAVLSRYPSSDERERLGHLLPSDLSQQAFMERMEDLIWVLLNTAECAVCP